VAVARDGERATPPVPAPGPLRRYLGFARLPDPALEVARRVLDDDEDFRARVAAAVDEARVGRAGWLFLIRPDGWKDEVEQLRQAAAAEDVAAKEERSEREAQRRLAGAEAAAARAEAARVNAAAEADRLRAALDEERRAASGAVGEVDRLREEIARLGEERAAAIRRVKDLEAQLADRSGELRTVRHELRMAQAELAQSLAVEATAPAPAAEPSTPAQPPARAPAQAPAEQLDRRALAAAVAEAAAAAEHLSAALAAASALVEPTEQPAPMPADGPVSPGNEPRSGARRRPPARRRPVPLPPGILDDGPAAAEHLVRQPGALVLVDGYNVSQAQWHGLPPAEQRRRLLDACAELHARCGADVEVVFDGSGEEPTAGALVRASVRYRFTPSTVEADDALLARLDEEPSARPVVVASSDRRVAEGARLRGANVVGARQFLAALRR
jgi:predicted RNA-binding protein with PIN domain